MSKGTYLLILRLEQAQPQLRIGRLGQYDFAAGYYLYVGSAFGSGGLRARLAYHQRPFKDRPRWHIDYLRLYTHLEEIWAVACAERLEHAWGSALMAAAGVQIPVPGFGASDSRLPAHLFYLPVRPSPRFLSRTLLADCWRQDRSTLLIDIQRFPPPNHQAAMTA